LGVADPLYYLPDDSQLLIFVKDTHLALREDVLGQE
jgi:hypothetical protein